jgi:hypothetical protein
MFGRLDTLQVGRPTVHRYVESKVFHIALHVRVLGDVHCHWDHVFAAESDA